MVLKVDCNKKRGSSEKRHYFSWDNMPSAERPQRSEPTCPRPDPVRLAREWQASMGETGESRADLARRLGVSRARVTQVLGILDLAPGALELLEHQTGPGMVSERALRDLRALSPTDQRGGVLRLVRGQRASGTGDRPVSS